MYGTFEETLKNAGGSWTSPVIQISSRERDFVHTLLAFLGMIVVMIENETELMVMIENETLIHGQVVLSMILFHTFVVLFVFFFLSVKTIQSIRFNQSSFFEFLCCGIPT